MGLLNYTYKDIIKKLKSLGYTQSRQGSGSHEIRIHREREKKLTIPNHGSKNISHGVVKQIIKSTGMSNREFNEYK